MASNTTSNNSGLDRTHVTIYCVILFLLGAFGFFGNLLTGLVIAKSRRLQTSHMRWVTCLAITDGLFCLFAVPAEAVMILIHFYGKPLPPIVCSIENVPHTALAFGSPFGQALIAVVRLLAVFKPNLYQRHLRSTRNILLLWVILVWVFPGFMALLAGVEVFGGYNFVPNYGMCAWNINKVVWKRTMEITFTYGPCVIILASYIAIFAKITTVKGTVAASEVRKRAKGTLMMFASCVFFMLMILPSALVETTHYVFYQTYPHALYWFFYTYWLNLAFNPVSIHFSIILLLRKEHSNKKIK